MHDFNGGILTSGLFWTQPEDDDSLHISRDGRRAVFEVRDLPVVDSFQFFGPDQTPASVSHRIEWRAAGAFEEHGSGDGVDPEDPAAFLGRIAVADSKAHFRGTELGFSFRSTEATTVSRGYAQMGRSRNGAFL